MLNNSIDFITVMHFCVSDQGGLEVRSDGHRSTISLHLHIRLYRRHLRYLPASSIPLRPRKTHRCDSVQGGPRTRHARHSLRIKKLSFSISTLSDPYTLLQNFFKS
ncbi:hypothetical protein NPIL_64541 [Nephila pilipes]|uniref:Uncharacterized protein n=1 Tax=Nephila pilipes TaxID=299642 RepID=A0A8X6TG11_NEPPI|nr:hypothetical protein NPIL_64541 [Nephila pilipes]